MAQSASNLALLRRDFITGAYELALSEARGQVYVASSPAFGEGQPGFIHVLDAETLQESQRITLPRKAFALALDEGRGRLYVGHTLDGALSVVDLDSGSLVQEIQLGRPDAEGRFEHSRMIRLDPARGLAFVTSPGGAGLVWIIDTARAEILHRIEGTGLWTSGAAYDAARGILYTSGGGEDEIAGWDVTLGTRCATIRTGDTTAPGREASKHFFLNLALDAAGQRLFATDSIGGTVHAFDIASGTQTGQAEVGIGALDLTYLPARDLICATWRGDSRASPGGTGGITLLDAADLSLRHRLDVAPHPNTIRASADGARLWATVKIPYAQTHPAWSAEARDGVLRLDLDRLG